MMNEKDENLNIENDNLIDEGNAVANECPENTSAVCEEDVNLATVQSCDNETEINDGNNPTFKDKVKNKTKKFFNTIWSWTKRTFMGASKETADVFSVEAIESPGKQIVKAFFSNKLAVLSLIVLIVMFGLAFFGSLASPLDLSYTEPIHKNIAPGLNMMKVPKDLSKDVKSISSFSYFSVGLSNSGKLYVWGNKKIPNSPSKANMEKIPKELDGKKIAFASAGFDHAIAITTEGKVVGWGEYENGQYGHEGSMVGSSYVLKMPDVLMNGTIDVSQIKQLVCGNMVSVIVMKDGSTYCWGNYSSGSKNLKKVLWAGNAKEVDKVAFTGTSAIALKKDGTVIFDEGKFDNYEKEDGTIVSLKDEYFAGRKVVDIAASGSSIAFLMDDGELIISGLISDSVKNNINKPVLEDDERITQIGGGRKHYTIITNKNKAYSFGNNTLKQCEVKKANINDSSKLIVGAFQNYIVNGSELESKWGLKGYVMGTDEFGRDVLNRIINGGKMTMTVGAIAVIISSIIGIVIGCISGYFGGHVDMILMRVTEIFSAIPFLPFALILSAILAGSNLTENMRIFMIMVILGLLSWTGLARMVRGQVLAEREKEFVIAAKAMGVKEGKIAFKHILPNIISVILVNMTLDFAGCMLTEASLSYLGFGVQLPRPTWGNMLNGCNNEIVIQEFWWRWLFPALFLLFTTISINIIGDTLRDVMDPKSSREK